MAETTTTFATSEPVTLVLDVPAGEVRIEAAETGATSVELVPLRPGDADASDLIARTRVEQRGGDIVIDVPRRAALRRTPQVRCSVVLPEGSRVRADVASADVRVSGTLDAVEAKTASGDLRLGSVMGDVRVRGASGYTAIDLVGGSCSVSAASGDVAVGEVAGSLAVDTASGDVDVQRVDGGLRTTTASGDVRVGAVTGDVQCRSASGDLTLESVHAGTVTVTTASGDVRVGIAPGSAAWLDVSSMSGDASSALDGTAGPEEGQPTVELRVRTMSGEVDVRRAS